MDCKGLTDFHTHILPHIDDGSRSSAMTADMLREESNMNVTRIVATPHFYADRISIEQFIEDREASLDKLHSKGILSPAAPQILKGAEVFFFPGMSKAEKLDSLCIEGTDTILVEMPFVQWTEDIYREIYNILQKRHMKVVLAHIERYAEFQKSKDIWNKVLALPVTLQFNAGSFTGSGLSGGKKRRMCLKMLKERPESVLGSDCHNLDSRAPNLDKAQAVIEDKLGRHAFEIMQNKAEELLRNEK